MKYARIVPAVFIERPNRFIARCLLDGREVIAHVKNTGRCRELLLPGAAVYLQCHDAGGSRKTAYSLIGVEKALPGGWALPINMDSQAPNAVVAEWLLRHQKEPRLPGLSAAITLLRPEAAFGGGRFDFYLETPAQKGYIEVKGVTLEENGAALFPDAPTLRGIKHVEALAQLAEAGFYTCVFFVVAFQGASFFAPNDRTHPAFGAALQQAQKAGVHIVAYDSDIASDSFTLRAEIPVRLEGGAH